MALQFRCQACNEPVEVDDEAAGQMVICPYCRKLSQAPAVSDPTIQIKEPVETPLDPGSEPTSVVPVATPFVPPAEGNGLLSWLSLASAGLAVLCFLIVVVAIVSIVGFAVPSATMADVQKDVFETMQTHLWMIALNIFGSWVAPFLGIILGAAALIKGSRPRWPAIVGLIISGLFILLSCAGTALSLAVGLQ